MGIGYFDRHVRMYIIKKIPPQIMTVYSRKFVLHIVIILFYAYIYNIERERES